WRGAACATPLLLKLDISYQGSFLYCLHNLGQFIVGEDLFSWSGGSTRAGISSGITRQIFVPPDAII
ncbi:MAG: hypothetical protein KH704_16430, partial [Clostridiales bacterium]|nr:hypothetical protein [Clostridiales bacterium]